MLKRCLHLHAPDSPVQHSQAKSHQQMQGLLKCSVDTHEEKQPSLPATFAHRWDLQQGLGTKLPQDKLTGDMHISFSSSYMDLGALPREWWSEEIARETKNNKYVNKLQDKGRNYRTKFGESHREIDGSFVCSDALQQQSVSSDRSGLQPWESTVIDGFSSREATLPKGILVTCRL